MGSRPQIWYRLHVPVATLVHTIDSSEENMWNVCLRTVTKLVRPSPTNVAAISTTATVAQRSQKGVTEDGGVVYHGFTYYPRFPGQEDPPYEPSKVFMVQRIKCLKGKPYWDKNLMKQLGLDGSRSEIALIANTPAMNAMLWKVKHLIRITPITFPQGVPQEGDIGATRLLENGQLVFVPQLKADTAVAQVQAEEAPDIRHLDGETLRKHLRLKWIHPWK